MKNLFLLSIAYLFSTFVLADGGYSIKIKLENYPQQQLFLGYYYGEKPYSKDTATINEKGFFVFEGTTELPGGIYILIMPPNNTYFQIIVNPGEQHFTIRTDATAPTERAKVEGSLDNRLFFDYLNYLSARRPDADTLRKQIEKLSDNPTEKEKRQAALNKINQEVEKYRSDIVNKYPKSLTAALIRSTMELKIPEFEGSEKEIQFKQWRYALDHWFDNVDLADPRLLYTPFLFGHIDQYIQKMNVQHPDSLSKALDIVLTKAKPAPETFKFYLIHYLNFFAKSEIVGMDAVYVHLVEKYYATGQAPWTEKEQLEKIIENGMGLKPTLIGKIAPNIELIKRDGSKMSLHEVDSDYTILYIWKYDCGHCKKSTPIIKEFYEKYKDKGVKIVAICFQFGADVSPCWNYVDENGIQDWIHTVDPYNRSRYRDLYYIRSTPQIYILDRKKEILSKRIGASQLEEVMNRIIEMKNKEKEKDSGK